MAAKDTYEELRELIAQVRQEAEAAGKVAMAAVGESGRVAKRLRAFQRDVRSRLKGLEANVRNLLRERAR